MFNWTEYFCTTSTFISTSLTPTHHTSREWLDKRALEAYFQIYVTHILSILSAFMLHWWLRADKYLEPIFFFILTNLFSKLCLTCLLFRRRMTWRCYDLCRRKLLYKVFTSELYTHHRDCCFGWFTQSELTILNLLSILFSLALCRVFYTTSILWLCK